MLKDTLKNILIQATLHSLYSLETQFQKVMRHESDIINTILLFLEILGQ